MACRRADLALGEVGDQDAALVHEPADVDGRARLADDEPQAGRAEQHPDLVLYWRDDLDAKALVVPGELVLPVPPPDRTGAGLEEACAIAIVNEQAGKAQEGGAGSVEEEPEAIVEDVDEARRVFE